MDLFQKSGFNTKYNKYIDGVKDSCYADKLNNANINYNGDVFKCTARDYKPESREGILLNDGTIEWNVKYYNRMNVKFNNPPCLKCTILPICNGSCSQKALENLGKEYCINNFDENNKIDIIKERLKFVLS